MSLVDTIADLQTAIAAKIAAGSDLAGLVLVTSDDLAFDRKISAALSGAGLVAILVSPDLAMQPTGTDTGQMTATVYIRVVEKVMQNRSAAGTQSAGSWWACHIASWLWQVSVAEEWTKLTVESVTQEAGTDETLEYLIRIKTDAGFIVEDETPQQPPINPQ